MNTSNLPPFELPPEHTKRYSSFSLNDINEEDTILIAKSSLEERGQLKVWSIIKENDPSRIIEIEPGNDPEYIIIHQHSIEPRKIYLVNQDSLKTLVESDSILFDISGLPHGIWAPILRAIFEYKPRTKIVYAEPESYKSHPHPASETSFDLSKSFLGLAPLPGFTNLIEPGDENPRIFVPLLGFEGNRPGQLVNELDPPLRVIPVVGVPGFQLEFPAYSVACNRKFLKQYQAYHDIQFARASCPFEMFNTLKDIHRDHPGSHMYIAPVGTKPHSLGGILYALANPDHTEIMYDHPVKKDNRTKGVGMIHIYDYNRFADV